MEQYASQIILGISAIVTGGLSSYALLVRARATASQPRQLLIRLWDWLDGQGLAGRVPEHLRVAIVKEITRQESDSDANL